MKSKIMISGMEFYAFHGCFKEEKIIGTRFKVDVTMHVDILEAAQTDDLTKTVNYQAVRNEISTIIAKPVNIIEHLNYNILMHLKKCFPQVLHWELTVYKLNPSIGGKTEWVAVKVDFPV